jgi:hypothetical protein
MTRATTCSRPTRLCVSKVQNRSRRPKAIAADKSSLAFGAGPIAMIGVAGAVAGVVLGQAQQPGEMAMVSRRPPKDNPRAARVLQRAMSSRSSYAGRCVVRAVIATGARPRRMAGLLPTMPTTTEVARQNFLIF